MDQNSVKRTQPITSSTVTEKTAKLIADSIFAQLQKDGCNPRDIITVSSHLLSLVTVEIQKQAQSQ